MVVGFRVPDRALDRVVCDHDRPARARGGDVRQNLPDSLRGQLAQRFPADTVGERFEGVTVERDGLLGAAIEAVTQPVLYGLADRVAAVRAAIPAVKSA